jgi:hypothetical protein
MLTYAGTGATPPPYAHVCSRMLTYAGTGATPPPSPLHICSRMLAYAHACSRMLVYAGTEATPPPSPLQACSRMLTYLTYAGTGATPPPSPLHICSRMLTHAHACWCMPEQEQLRLRVHSTYAHVCSRMLTCLTYAGTGAAPPPSPLHISPSQEDSSVFLATDRAPTIRTSRLPMLMYAHACSRMLTYAGTSRLPSTGANAVSGNIKRTN